MESNLERAARSVRGMADLGKKFSPGEKKGALLSECARLDDQEQANQGADYTAQEARLAAVHARQDIAAVYGFSSFIAQRVALIGRANILIFFLLTLILWRVW